MKALTFFGVIMVWAIIAHAEGTTIIWPTGHVDAYGVHKYKVGDNYYFTYRAGVPRLPVGCYSPGQSWERGAFKRTLSPIPTHHVKIEYAKIRFYVDAISNSPIPFRCTRLTLAEVPAPPIPFWTNVKSSPSIVTTDISSTGWTSWFAFDANYIPYQNGWIGLGFYMVDDTASTTTRYLEVNDLEIYIRYYQLPLAPGNFNATTDGYLSWSQPTGPRDGYHIHLSTDPNFSSYTLFTRPSASTSFGIPQSYLQENTQYYVRIAGYRQGQQGTYDGDFARTSFHTPVWYPLKLDGHWSATKPSRDIPHPHGYAHLWWWWEQGYPQYPTVCFGVFDYPPEPPYSPRYLYPANCFEVYAPLPWGGYWTCNVGANNPNYPNSWQWSKPKTIVEGEVPDPVVVSCTDTLALYPPWSQKIVVDSLQNIHIVYTSGDSVYYVFSDDKGHNFSNPLPVAQGKFPAVGISNCGIDVVYLNDNKIYFTRKTENWSQPVLVYENPALINLLPPAFAIDKEHNLGYLSWKEKYTDYAGVSKASINLTNPGQVIASPLDISPKIHDFASPSISIKHDGTPIIVWSKMGKVYLNDGIETKEVETGEGYAINPMVAAVGDNIKLIWQTSNKNLKQINYTEKTWWGWTKPVVVKECNLTSPPIITGPGHILYCENEDGISYLNYLGISEDGLHTYIQRIVYNEEATLKDANAYNFATWPKNPIYTIFLVPGQQIKLATISGPEIPNIYLNCGIGQSPHTMQAYEIKSYSNLPPHTADIDSQRLSYHFTGFNTKKRYRIRITGFQNELNEIRERVKFDNTNHGLFKIPKGKFRTFEKWLPPSYYADGEVYLTLEKQTGYAIASEIFIYEYESKEEEKDSRDGTQTEEETNMSSIISIHPNPSTGNTRILFDVSLEGQISLKVYNNLGQLVRILKHGNLKSGRYTINWNGADNRDKKLPTGIYFLVFDNGKNRQTRKIIKVE